MLISLQISLPFLLLMGGIELHESDDFANTSLQNIVNHFAEPLVKAGVDVMVIEEEWLET